MKADVCIISAFGRGNWLAAALANKGKKVSLLDVSASMGRWAPEDWEGPFGFFHDERLQSLQLERVNEEDYYDSVNEGFTIWLKDGPIDLKGPLSAYHLEKARLLDAANEYLVRSGTSEGNENVERLESEDFRKTWIVHLAYLLAANRYSLSPFFLQKSMKPLPLFTPFSVRRVTRKGLERSLTWCQEKGVDVFRDVKLRDISLTGRQCDGIEIESSWSGVVTASHYVWMLTGEETARFSSRVLNQIFPQGILKSAWSWVRYRIQLGEGEVVKSLPVKFVMLQDIYLPWTHENLCLAQRAVNHKDIDLWVKIPAQHRFQRYYLQDLGEKICHLFNEKIPNCVSSVVDMPQDFLYDENELGPSRFPVYDVDQLEKYSHHSFKNVYFESPETWCPQDLTGQLLNQSALFDKIQNLSANIQSSTVNRSDEVSL